MGWWGYKSHDGDGPHDHLCIAGRRNGTGFNTSGTLTNAMMTKYFDKIMTSERLQLKEYKVQKALGCTIPLEQLILPAEFVGITIWSLNRGWEIDLDVLKIAYKFATELLYDKVEISKWRLPLMRRYCLAKEMCRLKFVIEEKVNV